MATRKELDIPLDSFIFRIAWYELQGETRAADVLRLLAADFRPPYRVDETVVQAKVAELHRLHDIPPALD